MVRFDTVRRSRFGALWDGILRFVGFGYGGQGKVGCVELWRGRSRRGGSGTIRLGWVWFRAVRFDMAVKEGQLSAGRDEFRLDMAVWVGLVQAGRVTFRYGGLRQGGQGNSSYVEPRRVPFG